MFACAMGDNLARGGAAHTPKDYPVVGLRQSINMAASKYELRQKRCDAPETAFT